MATRSFIYLRRAEGGFTKTYCHFDGYRSHMLPALRLVDRAELAKHHSVRQIRDDGSLDLFDDEGGRREPTITHYVPKKDLVDFAYIEQPDGTFNSISYYP